MKHTLLTIATALCLAPVGAQAAAPRINAFMAESEAWLDAGVDAVALFGFYTFTADGSEGIQTISPTGPDNDWAESAGVWAGGKYYCFSTAGSWIKYTLTYRVIDSEKWSTETSKTYTYSYSDKTSEESQRAYLVPSDMAYDAINDVIYVAARKYASQLDSYLCTLDRNTGLLTRIGEIPSMAGLTADSEGKLYGIGIDGKLYTVNAATAECTAVGHTGFWPSDGLRMSCTTDFTDGAIYLALFGFPTETDRQWNTNAIFGMVKIDPATAKGKLLWDFPRNERFTAVNIYNAHPLAPADIADFSFGPTSFGSTTAKFEFTVPSLTSASKPLNGKVTVKLFIDNEQVSSEQVTPGTKYTKSITGVASGSRRGSAQIISGEHEGNKAYANAFFGQDAPAAVSNLTLTADDARTTATVSWTAPATGENGSPFDPEKIRYKVVKYPGGTILKRSLKETSFTDPITHEYAATYYTVTPYNVDEPTLEGKTKRTNTIMMGVSKTLPYSEKFDTADSMNAFTLIDVDGDGSDEWASPCWKYDELYACAFYYGRRDYNANDWLITPPLSFDPDKLYRLTYRWYAYYGYGSKFRVALGSEATVDGMDRELQRVEKASTAYDMPGFLNEIIFAVRPGDRFIGFHHQSENMEHLSIDDIYIEEYGDSRTPDHVTDLQGARLTDSSLRLRLTMPTVNARGDVLTEKMSLHIYRAGGEDPIANVTNLSPGQKVEWTDEDAVKGINSYVVMAVNSIGEGLSDAISVDLSDAVPTAMTGVTATFINERQIEIRWDELDSEVGENGNPIDLNEVRYLVFKPVPDAEGLITYKTIGRDLVECRFIDSDPMSGLYDRQQGVQYMVSAVNGAGQGYASESNSVIIGPAYSLPVAETWKNQEVLTYPWAKATNGANWYVRHQGYDPMAEGQDGYGLLTCEVNTDMTVGSGAIMTPRIDFSSMTSPTLTFWYWTAPSYSDDVAITLAVEVEGQSLKYLPTTYRAKSATSEWKKVTVSLADYATARRASVYIIGRCRLDQCLHLDNLSISGSAVTSAVRAEHIAGPDSGREGTPMEFTATVRNMAATAATGVKVALKLGAATVATATVGSIPASSTAEATLTFTPTEAHIGATALTLEVTAASLTIDGHRPEKELEIRAANLPYVHNLAATPLSDEIVLTWGVPTTAAEPETVIDTFEAYEDFTIDDLGAWTLTDGDGFLPFKLSNGQGGTIEWPNCGMPQSFMNFNPVTLGAPFSTISGEKMLICWGSPFGANDDWLISPELSGEQHLLSFFAAAVAAGDTEKFNVLVSRTDADPASFMAINGTEPITVGSEWDLYHFAIPAGTKHFAIQYVSKASTGLKIDDVLFHAAHNPMRPTGYNVYCNGSRLNTEPVTEQMYFHSGVQLGSSYTYTVRPVFGNREGADSNEINLIFTSISEIEGATGDAADEQIHDLLGRRVTRITTPGLYIINGRKVLR